MTKLAMLKKKSHRLAEAMYNTYNWFKKKLGSKTYEEYLYIHKKESTNRKTGKDLNKQKHKWRLD